VGCHTSTTTPFVYVILDANSVISLHNNTLILPSTLSLAIFALPLITLPLSLFLPFFSFPSPPPCCPARPIRRTKWRKIEEPDHSPR